MRASEEPGISGLIFLSQLSDMTEVEGEDFQHVFQVRRTKVGASLIGADGSGNWRRYIVSALARRTATLQAESTTRRDSESEFSISIACATTKGEKPELTVSQLTELGVDEIIFFTAERSQLKLNEKQLDRLRKVARESAMQCRRASLPVVSHLSVSDLVARNLVVADISGDDFSPAPDCTYIVGPEGGWSQRERDLFMEFPKIKLGDNVLRATTAAAAIAAQATYCGRSATNSTH